MMQGEWNTLANSLFSRDTCRAHTSIYVQQWITLEPPQLIDRLCIANPDSFIVGKTTSYVSWCGNTFYCNDVRIFDCGVIDTYNSSTTCILNLTYKIQIDHGVSFDQAVVGENWLMDSHICPSNMDQGIGTKTCGLDNVPPPPPPPPPPTTTTTTHTHTHTHTHHTTPHHNDDLKFA